MNLTRRPYQNEDDYWRIRNFLREVFLRNDRSDLDCHVALLDHWRWHYVLTCQETAAVDQVTTLWETPGGEIAAVLHPICHDEICMVIYPDFRNLILEDEMIAYAEVHHSDWTRDGQRILYVPIYTEDDQRREILVQRGFYHQPRLIHHWQRDFESPIPDVLPPPGYEIRSMGGEKELPARSWASWRAFHEEEPEEHYDGDYTWYHNMQSAPLYRRDLDILAATPSGEIGAFCTISYDDYTRSAVIVLEGTAAGHRQRDLEKAITIEGMRRLKSLGCTRLFAIAGEKATNALYSSTMQTYRVVQQWVKIWNP
jgi:hypothetical protein